MLQLHVWGYNDKLAMISPDCLTSVWLLALTVPSSSFQIVTSSNTNISTTGQLPTLITPDGQYDGLIEIAHYLTDAYSLDSHLTLDQLAINKGAILYIQGNIQRITDYTLFLNKDNYEKYTRAIYRQYLPFPMQYNTPLYYRSEANEKCSVLGLSVEDKTEVEEEMLKHVPTVSKLQKLQHETMIDEKLVLKNSLSNMRCLNLLKSMIETVMKLKSELNGEEDGNLFGEALSSCDLLLLAHLFVITNHILPDQFITTFLNQFQPDLLDWREKVMAQLDEKLENVEFRGPTFRESPNLFNAIKRFIL